MFCLDDIVHELERQFYHASEFSFRRFLRKNPDQREWIIASDYSWGDKSFPHDAVVFTIYPRSIIDENFFSVFPSDFKDIKVIDKSAVAWFWKKKNAFHIAIILNNNTSILHTPEQGKNEVVVEGIKKTIKYLEVNKSPKWVVEEWKGLQGRAVNSKIFSNVILLSLFYTFIVGILVKERQIKKIMWCSDRDNITTWRGGVLYTFSLINAVRNAGEKGQKIDATELPFIIINDKNHAIFDPLIRPPDLLATPLASWNYLKQGSVREQGKYGSVYRDILTGNKNISLIRLKIGTETLTTSHFVFK